MEITVTKPVIEPKGWGAEVVVINCEDYCGKILKFQKGGRGSLHAHRDKHETWLLLSGKITLETLDTNSAVISSQTVERGSVVDIPPMCPHRVIALEKTDIMEVSTPHEDSDTYRIAPGDSQQ